MCCSHCWIDDVSADDSKIHTFTEELMEDHAVAGQKKECSSLTFMPSGQQKLTGRSRRFQKGRHFFQQRTVEFVSRPFAEESTLPSGMEKPVKKQKVTHHTCDDFTDSESENDNTDDNSCGEGKSCITDIIARYR